MGAASGGLVCRDFDTTDSYEHWKSAHPELAARLPTVKTGRGFHVYFRGSITRIIKGSDGELRGAGYTILPPSRHPSGGRYDWIVPLRNGQVPEVLDPAIAGLGVELVTETTEDTELTEKNKAIRGRATPHGSALSVFSFSVSEAIQRTLPKAPGERNRKIFEFARILKSMPHAAAAELAQLKPLVRQWHQRALPNIGTKCFDDSWFDFTHAWKRVKFPAGQEPLAAIVEKARNAEPPDAAEEYESTEVRLLISICRELQNAVGSGPFFLSCRKAGELLNIPHVRAARYLDGLCTDGVLKVVEKGGQGKSAYKATRFQYVAT